MKRLPLNRPNNACLRRWLAGRSWPGRSWPGRSWPGRSWPGRSWPGRSGQLGFTLTELFVVCVVLTSLSAVAFPIAKFSVKRQKEMELQYVLRKMRNAIDEYKRYSDAGLLPVDLGTDGYPAELELLTEAHNLVGQGPSVIKRFMRRIPIDPMTGEAEWELRSYQDDVDTRSWGGENVYDVKSASKGVGLNGIPYAEW